MTYPVAENAWNHNTHYHHVVLTAVPTGCHHALDVGCGHGLLARQLTQYSGRVTALDLDRDSLAVARAASGQTEVFYLEGDLMTYPFPREAFDFISVVATLHHLPLVPALERLRELLRPGGVLVIVGLYRCSSISDYGWAAIARPIGMTLRRLRRILEVRAPLKTPRETLGDIRDACRQTLPGAVFRRRLLFRYSIVWRKP